MAALIWIGSYWAHAYYRSWRFWDYEAHIASGQVMVSRTYIYDSDGTREEFFYGADLDPKWRSSWGENPRHGAFGFLWDRKFCSAGPGYEFIVFVPLWFFLLLPGALLGVLCLPRRFSSRRAFPVVSDGKLRSGADD